MILALDVFDIFALVPSGEGLRGDLESYRSSIAILVWESLLILPEQAFICDKPAPLIQVLNNPTIRPFSQPFLVMVKLVESFHPLWFGSLEITHLIAILSVRTVYCVRGALLCNP